MRKFFEKLVEGGLLISGSVSSLTILLIVVFLFKEAGGLFNTPSTEEGYVLAVHNTNDVAKLSPEQLMDIFDGNITNWKEIGGNDVEILPFRLSDLTNYYSEEELGSEFQYVPQKISELIKILKSEPIKLKQGVIDFWIPIFLFIRQQDFAIYNEQGAYVMNINKELFELLQKKPGDYSIKAFNVSGIKIEFFKKYRQFLKKDDGASFTASSFIETFKPFLQFYRSLNDYAKSTNKFEHPTTAPFRNVLASAKDPEKAFFEDLPEALGFRESMLSQNSEFLEQYIQLIKGAVHELNICYDNLLRRINDRLVDALSLPEDYEDYKGELVNRYKGVKKYLLTSKCKNFLDRVLAPSETMKEFLEKISNVVIDKRLNQLKDKEEEYLLDNLVFLFHELDRYVSISDIESDNDEVFNFEIASNTHKIAYSQTYRLPENQKIKADTIASKIDTLLTGDDNLDVCILLKMLNDKLGK